MKGSYSNLMTQRGNTNRQVTNAIKTQALEFNF